jgi:hypothetical protein
METMDTDGHCRGLERSHIRGEKDAKADGIRKKMSQGDLGKEMIELRVQLNHIRQLLQRDIKENPRQGWSMKTRVKWPIMQLYEEKLRERLEKLK